MLGLKKYFVNTKYLEITINTQASILTRDRENIVLQQAKEVTILSF